MKKLFIAVTLLGAWTLAIGAHAQAEKGKELAQKKMCAACHGPGKKGGDLKDSKIEKTACVKFLKDPKAANPKGTMPAVKGTDEELNALCDYVLGLRK